jgi:YVTN family beta-propeller protein
MLTFSRLSGIPYWVEVLASSPTGHALSPLTGSAPGAGGNACGGEEAPGALFADPDNGEIYVADQGTTSVSVLNASNAELVATISLPPNAGTLAFLLYVPEHSELYVGSSEVYVIDTTTNTLLTTQPVAGGIPFSQMVYDPLSGLIYGSYWGYQGVTVTNGSTNSFMRTMGGVGDAVPAFFSPSNGEMYLQGTGAIYALAGNNLVKIQVPNQLSTTVYDQDTNLFYAVDNSTVYMVSPANNTLLAKTWELPPSPADSFGYFYRPVAYDPSNKDLYIFGMSFGQNNSRYDELLAVNTSNGSVAAEIHVQGFDGGLVGVFTPSFAYAAPKGELWATDLNNTSQQMEIVVIDGNNSATFRNLTGLYFLATAVLDPAAGVVVGVASSNAVVSVDASSGSESGTVTVGTCAYGMPLP